MEAPLREGCRHRSHLGEQVGDEFLRQLVGEEGRDRQIDEEGAQGESPGDSRRVGLLEDVERHLKLAVGQVRAVNLREVDGKPRAHVGDLDWRLVPLRCQVREEKVGAVEHQLDAAFESDPHTEGGLEHKAGQRGRAVTRRGGDPLLWIENVLAVDRGVAHHVFHLERELLNEVVRLHHVTALDLEHVPCVDWALPIDSDATADLRLAAQGLQLLLERLRRLLAQVVRDDLALLDNVLRVLLRLLVLLHDELDKRVEGLVRGVRRQEANVRRQVLQEELTQTGPHAALDEVEHGPEGFADVGKRYQLAFVERLLRRYRGNGGDGRHRRLRRPASEPNVAVAVQVGACHPLDSVDHLLDDRGCGGHR
mmetsp:Transcript_14705/g.43419  ORF Transcript_14705/g.43419 Transcript_14705/m.43419 type:complete len:366 (-) Transcript_14705:793-1890(-)